MQTPGTRKSVFNNNRTGIQTLIICLAFVTRRCLTHPRDSAVTASLGLTRSPPNILPEELIFPEVYRGCVQDGPFANLTLHLGPGEHRTTHCLVRGIGNANSVFLNSTAVANATKSTTFEVFRVQLEGRPLTLEARMHDGGHVAVGGDMSNLFSAPGGAREIYRAMIASDQTHYLVRSTILPPPR